MNPVHFMINVFTNKGLFNIADKSIWLGAEARKIQNGNKEQIFSNGGN